MASWSALRGTVHRLLSRGTAAGVPAAPVAPPGVAGPPTREVHAWDALPAVQRVLAQPLEPVAPLAAFTSSLTAFQNPSFLSRLEHEVNPRIGGMVNGLADLAPATPGSYGSGSALPVP